MRNRNVNKSSSLDVLITALCLDYPRREKAIRDGLSSRRTLTEYRYFNFKIYEAVKEVVGEEFAYVYIKEIGENIGYANTALDTLSEVAYKQRKKEVKENIAKKLHLED